MASVSLEEHSVAQLTAYKILGHPWTVRDISRVLRSRDTTTLADWSALYLQFKADHVIGTLPYRWESKSYEWECEGEISYNEADLIRVCFPATICVVVMRGSLFSNPTLSGKEKADVIKQELGLPEELPLMQSLGKQGKCAAIEECAGEWELVIPHSLWGSVGGVVEEEVLVKFRKHPKFPVTDSWSDGSQEGGGGKGLTWRKWEDECGVLDVIEDIEPEFLVDCS